MRPVVRIGLYLRTHEVMSADQLNARTVYLLIIIHGSIRDPRTAKQRYTSHPGGALKGLLHSHRGTRDLYCGANAITASQGFDLLNKIRG